MQYKKAVEYLNIFNKNKIKLGLERMARLMELLGNPQNKMKFVHVAGTNGKGSIVNYLANILSLSGLKVGLFTSPHLTKINQSIAINNVEISDADFSAAIEFIKNKIEGTELEEELTSFELLTAVALQYYCNNGCNIVILEVGMGGALDSTNIIQNTALAIISKISLDHTDYLGKTIQEIATVKSGIIKANCEVVVAPQQYFEVIDVIKNKCLTLGIYPTIVDDSYTDYNYYDGRQSFVISGIGKLDTSMLGKHQISNAATAVIAARKLGVEDKFIIDGIDKTVWPCRLELINKSPLIFIDGGHNLDGITSIVQFFKENYSKKVKLIFGVLKDKQYNQMIEALSAITESVSLVRVNNPRTADIDELGAIFKQYNIQSEKYDDLHEAIDDSLSGAAVDDIILITGSLYYVGKAREIIMCKLA